MEILLGSITIVCFIILVYPFLITILSLFSHKHGLKKDKHPSDFSFHCIVTAYMDLTIAYPLIESLTKMKYDQYKVTIIADQCQKVEFPFTSSKISIIYPEKALNSKVKSIQMALYAEMGGFDYSIVFDPDNLVGSDFLRNLSQVHSKFEVVQCRRVAKNLDSYVACLDAAGEYYKNFAERRVPFILGSSATIAGSGMSVRNDLLFSFIESNEVQSRINEVILGEDKMLQNFVVAQDKDIAFMEENLVYDEKITNNVQVKRQRTRWINAYFQNIRSARTILTRGILNLNTNQILFSLNSLYPPLFILFLVSGITFFLNVIIIGLTWPFFLIAIGIVVFIINFLFALNYFKAPVKVYRALFLVPLFIFGQVLALLNIKRSKNDFLVTEKKKIVL